MPDHEAPEAKTSASFLSRSEVLALLDELRGSFALRNSDFKRAWALYNGEHWGSEVGNPTPSNSYTLVANYIRPTVDRAVQDLLARMPGIQVMPRGVDEEARRVAEGCEGALYRCWERNDVERVFRQAAFNAVLYRSGWFYYWWDAVKGEVRFRSFSPSDVYPVYDGDRIVEVVAVSRRLTRELQRAYPKLADRIRPSLDLTDDPSQDGVSGVVTGTTDALGDGAVHSPRTMSGSTTVVDWYDARGNWVRVMGEAVHAQNLGYGTERVPFIPIEPLVSGDEAQPHNVIEDIGELNQYYDQLLSQQANVIRKYSDPPILDQGSGASPQAIKRAIASDGGVLPMRKDGNIRYLNWEGTMPDMGRQFERVENIIRDLSGRPRSAYGETATNQSGVLTNMAMSPTVTFTENLATMLGAAMSQLHADTLRLIEKFMSGDEVSYEGYRPSGPLGHGSEYFASSIRGRDIAGWYRNKVKWPSMVRTDDPIWIQSIISQVTSDPPLLPVYDAIEMLGHDDAEALLDRIQQQLEDPRMHPERLTGAIEAASALQGTELPPDMAGFDSTAPDDGTVNDAAEAAGSPHRSAL